MRRGRCVDSTERTSESSLISLPPSDQIELTEDELGRELKRFKEAAGMGFELEVKWLPGTIKYKDGRQLLEEVSGNTILIYTEKLEEAKKLVAHGFAEWLLNQYTRKYRMLINKLIELFEQIQYEEKEKVVEAISRILSTTNP